MKKKKKRVNACAVTLAFCWHPFRWICRLLLIRIDFRSCLCVLFIVSWKKKNVTIITNASKRVWRVLIKFHSIFFFFFIYVMNTRWLYACAFVSVAKRKLFLSFPFSCISNCLLYAVDFKVSFADVILLNEIIFSISEWLTVDRLSRVKH